MRKEIDIEKVLKTQLLVSSLLMTPVLYFLAYYFLPAATCGECVAHVQSAEHGGCLDAAGK